MLIHGKPLGSEQKTCDCEATNHFVFLPNHESTLKIQFYLQFDEKTFVGFVRKTF